MAHHLEVEQLSKRLGATVAAHNVGFVCDRGEVLAVIGENGAGKSTVVKILTGIHKPDAGRVRLGGKDMHFHNPQDAWRAGISAIHQETVMFDELSVAENIWAGNQPTRFGLVDWREMMQRTRVILERIDAKLNPQEKLKNLSVAQKHLVQIARALTQDASVVIMDEPTAALSKSEIEDFYRVVQQLKNEGKAILLITHKFDEIFAHSDAYVVLRDGQVVGQGRIQDTNNNELLRLMAGRELGQMFPKKPTTLGKTMLEVRNFSHPSEFRDINFSLRCGEILGVYGLVGAGRSEVMQAIFGLNPDATGEVYIDQNLAQIRSPSEALSHGLAYLPEDRQHAGAILDMPILENISLSSLQRLGALLSRRKEETLAMPLVSRLSLRAKHLDQTVSELSGGNQQKVVLGKWLATKPKVLILDEPTKGIDVGSKAAVHALMSELVAQDLAVVMVSSELPEIMGMSDRIVVMREGRIVAELEAAHTHAEKIVALATGVNA